MKKILIVIVVLAFSSFALFAAYETQVGSGSLNVYGRISDAGDPNFVVSQSTAQAERINLITNEDIQPGEAGVIVGEWSFVHDLQGSSVTYRVSYATTPMTSAAVTGEDPIPFSVIEYQSDGTTLSPFAGETYSEIVAVPGSNSLIRKVAVVLDSAVPSNQPTANDYNGSISVSLLAP